MVGRLVELAQKMPVIAIVGPRQSGKTTLAQATFKKHRYVSLEDLKNREFAHTDPRAFFQTYHNESGIILDEIQRVPELLSYIQVHVDEYKRPGYFILTGSQNFLVHEAITQTLAGRIAIFTLLPLSIAELKKARLLPGTIEECVVTGCYPRPYASHLAPRDWYPDYLRTYVERDVRSLRNVTDLTVFERFIGLCAGRIGQLLNVTSLANDCGVTVATAKSWLSLLEASYIIFLLQPYHKNVGKRLVKSPKLYFFDTGLACSALGIDTAEQVVTHYLRGGLVESLLIVEIYKHYYNLKLEPHIYFWRDKMGNEVDCVVASGGQLLPIEIKAGKTISSQYFDGLQYWYELHKASENNGVVLYAGDENQTRSAGRVVSWSSADTIL
jgi:predicted AAA+ superfamily ATPase